MTEGKVTEDYFSFESASEADTEQVDPKAKDKKARTKPQPKPGVGPKARIARSESSEAEIEREAMTSEAEAETEPEAQATKAESGFGKPADAVLSKQIAKPEKVERKATKTKLNEKQAAKKASSSSLKPGKGGQQTLAGFFK